MTSNAFSVFARGVIAGATALLLGVIGWGFLSGELGSAGPLVSGDSFGVARGASGDLEGEDLEGGVLVQDERADTIWVFDPVTGDRRGEIAVARPFLEMVPTPGGVSVFTVVEGAAELEVYSTTEYHHEATIELESERLGAGAQPEHLLFSENGDTLFVTWRNSPVVSVYSHSMRELSLRHEFEIPESSGPLLRNRRATRLYRSTPDGPAVVFARNGELLETISASPAAWRFNSGYTHLWGVDEHGGVQLVEERTSRLAQPDLPSAAEGEPVFASGAETAFVLSSGGRRVAAFESRTGRLIREIELPSAATHLVSSGAGTVWAVDEHGEVSVIDPSVPALQERFALQDAVPKTVVSSIVQREGSFACF